MIGALRRWLQTRILLARIPKCAWCRRLVEDGVTTSWDRYCSEACLHADEHAKAW